jgi:hypothetical protein
MRVKTTMPRTALASGRGKSEELLKANYKSYYNKKYDPSILKRIVAQELKPILSGLAQQVSKTGKREVAHDL